MKRLPVILGILLCALLASIYIYPIFSGLVLLPLDLLVSNSSPWHLAGQILLKNPYMQDSVLQMFPWKHLTFTSLSSGIIPLWNPFQFMGVPFMAAMKPLVFYPANILFLLGEVRAWNMLLWLQLFLSLWFTYLFVESLGAGTLFALFAGIAFAFNSLMVSVLEFGSEGHVLLWLPILLYFVKRYIDKPKPYIVAGIAVATACSIFAGQLQYFAYLSAVVFSFSLYYGILRKSPWKITVAPIMGIAVGSLIAGIQLLPGLKMFQDSYRGIIGSYATFSGGLLRPLQLLRLLSPDWFGNPVSLDLHGGYIEVSGYLGIIPLFFMLYAMIFERKNIYVKFFTWVAVAALLFSMDGIAQILYTLRIPIITSGYGSRLFSMFLFAGAVLAGLGLKAFVSDAGDRKKLRVLTSFIIIVGMCFAVGLFIGRFDTSIGVKLSNIKIEIALLGVLGIVGFMYLQVGKKLPAAGLVITLIVLILTFGDLFRMGYRFLTFSNKKFLYPAIDTTRYVQKQTASTLGRVYGLTEPEVNTELGVAGVDTYNPLFPLRTATLLNALQNRQGSKLMNNKYEMTQNPDMKPALDFLGVRYIVIPHGTNPAITLWNDSQYEKDITRVFEGDGNDIYENTTALPRFGLYYDVRMGIPDDLTLRTLSPPAIDFRKTILLTETLPVTIQLGTGSATLIHYGLNSASFNIETTSPAIFYLSDTYDAGWHASVNGQETPIYHANYNFRAVLVPTGKSVVTFWYLPASVVIGGVLSALGILVTLGLALSGLFFPKKKPEKIGERT